MIIVCVSYVHRMHVVCSFYVGVHRLCVVCSSHVYSLFVLCMWYVHCFATCSSCVGYGEKFIVRVWCVHRMYMVCSSSGISIVGLWHDRRKYRVYSLYTNDVAIVWTQWLWWKVGQAKLPAKQIAVHNA